MSGYKFLDRMGTFTMENPEIYMVFITSNMDERFDNYGVLRPLEQRH